jgi:hypothetical protein
MAELHDSLVKLREAVQDWVNVQHSEEGPCLLSEAVVIYECVSYTEQGEPGRAISYTIPTDNFSLSGALGLLDAGRYYIRRDILRDDDDD